MKYYLLIQKLEAACQGFMLTVGKPDDKSTWSLAFPEGATDDQKTAAQSVFDAAEAPLDRTPERTWTPYEFYQKLTSLEKAALVSSTDAIIQEFVRDMQLYQVVRPDSEECLMAMAYLVSAGVITEERKNQILA